jgi:hypothetical protein
MDPREQEARDGHPLTTPERMALMQFTLDQLPDAAARAIVLGRLEPNMVLRIEHRREAARIRLARAVDAANRIRNADDSAELIDIAGDIGVALSSIAEAIEFTIPLPGGV